MLRKALDKDPQFLAGLELVRDQDMYRRIITPADAKVSPQGFPPLAPDVCAVFCFMRVWRNCLRYCSLCLAGWGLVRVSS